MVSFLLAAALFMGGAKSPIAFSVWGALAIGWTVHIFIHRTPLRGNLAWFIAFNVGILLSQWMSLDPTQSYFWAVQTLVLSCVWLACQTTAPVPNEKTWWLTLGGLGCLTALVTLGQHLKGLSPYGLLPVNPNFNAVWMAALVTAYVSKSRLRGYEKVLSVSLAILIVIGHSRSGLLALLVGAGYARFPTRRDRWVLWAAGLAGLAALVIPQTWWINRLNPFENGARLQIWGVALKALTDRPLTGYGPGNFELAYFRHAFPFEGAVRYGHTTTFAHNDYLQALSEWGWPTAGLLIGGFVALLVGRRPESPLAASAKGILLALAAAAFFNPIFKMPFLVLLTILAAACLRPTAGDSGRPVKTPVYRRFLLLSYISLIGVMTVWVGARGWWASRQEWDRIVNWDRNDSEAWHELAKQSKNTNDLLVRSQNAAVASPEGIYETESLARALESLPGNGHIPEILPIYLHAIQIAPTRAVNYLAVARLLWRAREPDQTLAWAEKALALEPNYWEADFWAAQSLIALGKREEAAHRLAALIRRHHEFEKATPTVASSPYEEAILHYEADAVGAELAHIHPASVNGVK